MKRALKTALRRVERGVVTWRAQSRSPGRNFEPFSDDVIIVSYPRSGNTWTRFLIANLLSPGEAASFVGIEHKVPDIYKATRAQLAATPRPRVIKSHEYFDPRYPRVVYIVRDPRDVTISYYHYQRKTHVIADDFSMNEFVRRFVAGALSPYGSWGENVNSWLATRSDSPDFLLLRYEDMIERTVEALEQISSFLKLSRTPAELEQAVTRSSASEMRNIEKRDSGWSVTQKSRKDIPFVRSASAGGWKGDLSADAIETIEMAWGPLMSRLGYQLASDKAKHRVAALQQR